MTTTKVHLTIHGQLVSMKNSRELVRVGGRPISIKGKAARQYAKDFAAQVPPEAKRNLGSQNEPLRALVTVWYPSWRQDLDCALVYDLLQQTGVISDDRFIREKHEFAEIDSAQPRVEITIEYI